jgi:serine/threonine-protein kinase
VPELAIRIATERAPSAAKVNPAVPPGLAAVIATCLETNPGRRPRTVAELAVALQPFAGSAAGTLVNRVVAIAGQTLSDSSGRASRVSVPDSLQTLGADEAFPATMAGNGTAPPIQWTSPGNPPRRGIMVTLGVVGGLLVVLGGAGAVWWTTQRAVPEVVESAASVVVAPPVETAVPQAPVVSPIPVPPIATVEDVPVVAPSASADSRQRPQRPALRPVPQRTPKVERGAPAPAAPAAEQPQVTKPQPAERASCDPPFFFDAKGNRVFKQECL